MSDDATYHCASCGGVFRKGWTEAEAEAEYRRDFGHLGSVKRCEICDDCYARLMTWLREKGG
jgi:hypothetical protein